MGINVLMEPFWISVICAVLALLISITDKIVNNYGQVTIDINQAAKKLSVRGGSTLLSTLGEQKIFLPSSCGGKGTCGVCKVRILTSGITHLPTETPLLTEPEMKQGIHLGCQIKVKSNLDLVIPEELFNIKKYTTKVLSIKDVTYDIKEVYLQLEEPASISYKAGQYAQLIIPPYGNIKTSTQRAYSMLSTPQESGKLGFLIRLVPGGIATTYVFNHLKAGDSLQVIAPVGEFHLQDTDAIMLCIAGGSGMAPIRSILQDMREKNLGGKRTVWYFFGARTVKDIFYLDKFRQMEKEIPNFHFVPALSETTPGDGWDGETGLITEVLDRYLKTKIDAAAPREGYLCGSPGMLDACIKVMKANAIAPDKIYFDKFA